MDTIIKNKFCVSFKTKNRKIGIMENIKRYSISENNIEKKENLTSNIDNILYGK